MNPTETSSPTVLILGATGRLGGAAVRAFAQAGWRVVAQTRRAPPALPASGVQWVQARPADTTALAQAAQGACVVLHALNPEYTAAAWEREAPALTAAALEVAQALGATLMLPGNIYNYGDTAPDVLHEETPFAPHTPKGRVRVAMEAQLASSPVRTVVVRAGDFFGSGTGSWFDLVLAKELARGVLRYPGPGGIATAWAYLPDLAQALVKVAQYRAQLPQHARLHFAGHRMTLGDWQGVLTPLACERGWIAPGAALKLRTLPWALMRVLGWFQPVMASLVEMRYLWQRPVALDNTRLQALIGPEPHTPLPEAARAALNALHGQGAEQTQPALAMPHVPKPSQSPQAYSAPWQTEGVA